MSCILGHKLLKKTTSFPVLLLIRALASCHARGVLARTAHYLLPAQMLALPGRRGKAARPPAQQSTQTSTRYLRCVSP